MQTEPPVIARMQSYITQWEQAADDRALFLRCYMMMTANMLSAVEQQEFNDSAWINTLLHRFADYYYVALNAYERGPDPAPAVWRLAFNAARDPHITAMQKLLLGVNAHINYDLVLTLADLLRPEWGGLSGPQRALRYADHCRVNDIIGQTIDAVQDQVLEPAMPGMDFIDVLLGRVDERLISRLITRWRETVWENTTHLLGMGSAQEQAALIARVESEALRTGRIICPGDTRL